MDDDAPVGAVLGRRQLLRYAGAASVGYLALGSRLAQARSTSVCVVSPESIEGPYFLEERRERRDIHIDPVDQRAVEGVPLSIVLNVGRVTADVCRPIPGAVVDIWQCDAKGEYSNVDDHIIGFNTLGTGFLRGFQKTDSRGQVRFESIYPGWYHARCVHIHVKVRTSAGPGQNYEFTSQMYLDESVTDRVHALQPYARKGQRDRRHEQDLFFTKRGGAQMLLALQETRHGYLGTLDIGLDLANAETGKSDSWKLDPFNPANNNGRPGMP